MKDNNNVPKNKKTLATSNKNPTVKKGKGKSVSKNKLSSSGSSVYNDESRAKFMSAAVTVSRFKFATSQYYRSIGILLIATTIAAFEAQQYFKAKNFEPPVKYIPVYEDSTIVSPTPLNKPLNSDSYNRQWLADAATDIFSYSYTTIDTHGGHIKQYFTDNGYSTFWKQFSTSPDYIRVKNKNMNVVSMVLEPPQKLHDEEFKITGDYAYFEYKFKIKQLFISPTDGLIPVNYDMVATVIRQDQKQYKSGIAIHSIRVVSSNNID